ncbi:IS4 family transposase [Rhodococcus sp. NPDC080181]
MDEIISRRFTDHFPVGILAECIPRDDVEEAIDRSSTREKRSRLLPSRIVVYYVIALGLFFGESYDEVMRRLVSGLQFLGGWLPSWHFPTPSAITQARKRLGEEPFKILFHLTAKPLASSATPSAWFHGQRVLAIDGVVLDAPDSPENAEVFGYSVGGKGKGAYPRVRVVAVVECGTHAVVHAAIGEAGTTERTEAWGLVSALDPGSVLLADRGFFSLALWERLIEHDVDAVFRISRNMNLPAIKEFSDGSYLSVLLPSKRQSAIRKSSRRSSRGDITAENQYLLDHGVPCRVVEYEVEGSDEPYRVITTLRDHAAIPAMEIAALYHERWEVENVFDEIEVHQIGHGRVLRSKSPELVKQEIWGVLLAHYSVRKLVHKASGVAEIDPDRLSFIRALRIVRRQLTNGADFSPQHTPRDAG